MSIDLQGGNIAGAHGSARLLSVIAAHRPHGVVLTEAYHFDQHVPGYSLERLPKRYGAEAHDVALLVRDDVEVDRRSAKAMVEHWFGPFTRRRRDPRVYPVRALRVDGVRWPVLGAHLPPGGPSGGIKTRGRNKTAWHESAHAVRRWLRLRRRAVALGDFNANGQDVRDLIAPKGAKVAMASNVDGAIVKGATVTVTRLDAPDGMHGWFIAYITAN